MSDATTTVIPESQTINWGLLQVFLKAPSKKFVNSLFLDVYRFRALNPWPQKLVEKVTGNLDISTEIQAVKLLDAVRFIIHETVFKQLNPTGVVALFPEDFHQQLSELIAAIVTTHLQTWKSQARESQPGLPAFKSVDWRVDSTSGGDAQGQDGDGGSGSAKPKAIVSVEVQRPPARVDELPSQDSISFEIDQTTLKAMLEGLGRIRDQLQSISQR